MPPTYEFQCVECESVNVEEFRMAERPESITCACGGKANYKISMPNRAFKEAYLDGTKRKGFSELKEANRLHRVRDTTRDSEERKRISSEITRLGGDGLRKKGE